MALSADRIVVLKGEILGLPPEASGTIVTALTHFPFSNTQTWEPGFNIGDYTNLMARIDTILAAMSAAQESRVATLIDEFTVIATSPLKVDKAAEGAGGTLVDHAEQRENIRQAVANNLGIAVPRGGFLAEVRATYGASLAQWTSGGGLWAR